MESPAGSIRMVNVHQAKTQLSRLIDAAHAGEPNWSAWCCSRQIPS